MFGFNKKDDENVISSLLLIHESSGSESTSNLEAYKWLDLAMFAPSRIKKRERRARQVALKRVYPTSAYQTEKMRQFLSKAKSVVVDPSDPCYTQRYEMLQNIVVWSSKRYRAWSWKLIFAVVLSALAVIGMNITNNLFDIRSLLNGKEVVEAWSDPKNRDQKSTDNNKDESAAFMRYGDVDKFRESAITELNSRVEVNRDWAQNARKYVDSVSIVLLQEWIVNFADNKLAKAEMYSEELEAIPSMNFDDFKEYSIYFVDDKIDIQIDDILLKAYVIGGVFLLFIILYIIAQHPHGYTVTRLKIENAVVLWIQDFVISISIGMLLIIFYWFSFKSEKGTSAGNQAAAEAEFSTNLIKIFCIPIGLILLFMTSTFFMLYHIIQGLRRNYTLNGFIARSIDYTKRYAD